MRVRKPYIKFSLPPLFNIELNEVNKEILLEVNMALYGKFVVNNEEYSS